MRIEDLLDEYKAALNEAPLGDFDALLAAEAARQRRRRIVLPLFAAAAAAICMVLALPRPVAPPQTPPAPAQAPAQAPLPVLAAAAPEPAPETARPIRKSSARLKPIPADRPALEDPPFIPLAQSRLLPQSDVMQVLRVSVSSDRLAALGIATPTAYNAEGNSQVAAELLLGDDGLVRAVRVLR
jgi:hypothetical protein